MKFAILFTWAILFCCNKTLGQLSQEWFNQKQTQRKYLAIQIANLQMYLNYIKTGYRTANFGLNTIHTIKSGDYSLHDNFFTNQQKVELIKPERFQFTCVSCFQNKFDSLNSVLRKMKVSGTPAMASKIFHHLLTTYQTDISAWTTLLHRDSLTMLPGQRVILLKEAQDKVRGAGIKIDKFLFYLEDYIRMYYRDKKDVRQFKKLFGS
ncbi:hypothetical protein SAMN05444266_103113 [Chitinophaga jiangningensis]|uniref:Uncharacterized protein n=1 Tax=Chitinophaga jiangningensis TaxID=1419482 RepID=A0A1M7A430_9BACT|nr:hypothetical protein [Chitinophaga jiangningensis]SHL37359.1 hypothetical protein SAMN05444266_103113 [Chitinophaga jiangningensis]